MPGAGVGGGEHRFRRDQVKDAVGAFEQARITEHARHMIRTAWRLGARKDLAELRLRAWAHMLGFRGHFSTKTRHYSTTLGALRDARAECEEWLSASLAPALGTEGEPTHG